MSWYFLLLVFIIMPLGITIFMFLKKRKHLRLSPILVFVSGAIVATIIDPRIMDLFRVAFFSGYYADGSSTRTAMTILLVPVIVSIFCVVICKAAEAIKMRSE